MARHLQGGYQYSCPVRLHDVCCLILLATAVLICADGPSIFFCVAARYHFCVGLNRCGGRMSLMTIPLRECCVRRVYLGIRSYGWAHIPETLTVHKGGNTQ